MVPNLVIKSEKLLYIYTKIKTIRLLVCKKSNQNNIWVSLHCNLNHSRNELSATKKQHSQRNMNARERNDFASGYLLMRGRWLLFALAGFWHWAPAGGKSGAVLGHPPRSSWLLQGSLISLDQWELTDDLPVPVSALLILAAGCQFSFWTGRTLSDAVGHS